MATRRSSGRGGKRPPATDEAAAGEETRRDRAAATPTDATGDAAPAGSTGADPDEGAGKGAGESDAPKEEGPGPAGAEARAGAEEHAEAGVATDSPGESGKSGKDEKAQRTRGRTEDAPAQAGSEEETGAVDAPAEEAEEFHPAAVEEFHEEAQPRRSLAATALWVLVGILAVAAGTLWLAPKVAPHLPAPLARYLLPGQVAGEERFAALESALAAERAARSEALGRIEARLGDLAGRVEVLAGDVAATKGALEDVRATAGEALQAAQAAQESANALGRQLDLVAGELRAEIASLRDELDAAIAGLSADSGATSSAEIEAAVAALRSRVESLAGRLPDAAAVGALAADVDALRQRLAALEERVAALGEVRREVSESVRRARLQAALDTLAVALRSGEPYGEQLAAAESLAGAEAPPAVRAGAEAGLATAEELKALFPRYAKAAIAADIEARSGEDVTGRLAAWVRAQLAGRPIAEQEGSSVEAVTSRIAARLEEGRLAAALEEAETLPEHAKAALGDWLERLRQRVAAERALADWRRTVLGQA